MVIKQAEPGRSLFAQGRALLRACRRRKFVLGFIGANILVFYAVGLIYYGMVLHKTGRAEELNDIIHNLIATGLRVGPHYLKGVAANPEKVTLDIKFEDFQRIVYNRELCLARGIILDDVKKQDIPARLTHRGQTYSVTLQMTGKFLDHLRDAKKWSYQVKLKGDHRLFGMKEFMLLRPDIRGHLSDWVCHEIEKREGLIALKYDFIDVTVNGDHHGVYAIEEHFDKHVVESNRLREGIIFKPGLQQVFVYNRKKTEANATLNAQLALLEKLWTAFLAGDIPTGRLFDVDKLAMHYALADLVNGHHEHYMGNTHYYFNPITGLVEPIGREWGPLRYSRDEVTSLFIEDFGEFDPEYHRKVFGDPAFVTRYIQALDKLSQPEYLDNFFKDIEPEMHKRLAILYRDNPAYAYPKQYLYRNQKYIRSKIHPRELPVVAYYRGQTDRTIRLSFRRSTVLPVEIVNVAADRSVVLDPVRPVVLPVSDPSKPPANQLAEFTIPAGVAWSDNAANHLKLRYRIQGTSVLGEVTVLPRSEPETHTVSYDLIRQDANHREFAFVSVDEAAKQIIVQPGEWVVDRDLIVPPGYTFMCREGVRLNLSNQAKILSYSPLDFRGTEKNPVRIDSTDGTGQGLVVLNAHAPSLMAYVTFQNLSNPTTDGWGLTGALTFYQSPIHITRCRFIGNRSEDGLNVFRSDYTIDQSLFQRTSSDAFDADFSDGTITNCRFENLGNDAIDVSGSALEVRDVIVENAGDKGLSTGEESRATVTRLEVRNSEIGIGSKDKAENIIDDLTIVNCHLGVTAYQKKSEFGPASIKITMARQVQAKIPYLLEQGSTLIVDGQPLPPSRDNVKEILYGVEYGKASRR
jgi:hypothetical protein